MRTLTTITRLACAVALLASCEKEGPIGPQGPQGEQGPSGDDGNANVASTTVTFDQFLGGVTTFDYILNWSQITQDIIDDGVVLGFVNTSGGWTELNFSVPIGGEQLLYRGYAESGQYRVNMKRTDGAIIDAGDPIGSMNPLMLKVVLIAGGRSMSGEEVERLAQRELMRSGS